MIRSHGPPAEAAPGENRPIGDPAFLFDKFVTRP